MSEFETNDPATFHSTNGTDGFILFVIVVNLYLESNKGTEAQYIMSWFWFEYLSCQSVSFSFLYDKY